MNRAPLASIPLLLALAGVAAADEYTPQSLGTTGFVTVPIDFEEWPASKCADRAVSTMPPSINSGG